MKETELKLMDDLDRGLVEVHFTKVNGDERIMTCTTNYSIIPQDQHPKSWSLAWNGVYRVYDVEADGWRSFRSESVISVNIV